MPTARSTGERPSPGPSRSGSGSCPGATTWRSSHPPGLRDDVAATHRRAAGRYAEVEDRETARRLPGGAHAARLRRPPATAATSTDSRSTGSSTRSMHERVDRGLRPLRADSRLWDLAGDRAARMASTGIMSHTVAGNLGARSTARGIQLVRLRRGHRLQRPPPAGPPRRDELFTPVAEQPDPLGAADELRFNYVGVGLAFRSSTGRTFGSIVLTESPDIGRGRARDDDRRSRGPATTSPGRGPAPTPRSRPTPPGCATTTSRPGSTRALGDGPPRDRRRHRGPSTGTLGPLVRPPRARHATGAATSGPWSAELRIWVP